MKYHGFLKMIQLKVVFFVKSEKPEQWGTDVARASLGLYL